MRGLDLPLCQSPLTRRIRCSFVLAQFLYVMELGWSGHWSGAAGVVAIAAGWIWWSVRTGRDRGRQLRRLLVSAEGRLHGLTAAGEVVVLRLHPASLRLGRWVLLCLVGEGSRHLLLLGPDNLDPPLLAALRRRVFSASTDFD